MGGLEKMEPKEAIIKCELCNERKYKSSLLNPGVDWSVEKGQSLLAYCECEGKLTQHRVVKIGDIAPIGRREQHESVASR